MELNQFATSAFIDKKYLKQRNRTPRDSFLKKHLNLRQTINICIHYIFISVLLGTHTHSTNYFQLCLYARFDQNGFYSHNHTCNFGRQIVCYLISWSIVGYAIVVCPRCCCCTYADISAPVTCRMQSVWGVIGRLLTQTVVLLLLLHAKAVTKTKTTSTTQMT